MVARNKCEMFQSVRYGSVELLQVVVLMVGMPSNCAELMKICLSSSDTSVLTCDFETTEVIMFFG